MDNFKKKLNSCPPKLLLSSIIYFYNYLNKHCFIYVHVIQYVKVPFPEEV